MLFFPSTNEEQKFKHIITFPTASQLAVFSEPSRKGANELYFEESNCKSVGFENGKIKITLYRYLWKVNIAKKKITVFSSQTTQQGTRQGLPIDHSVWILIQVWC